MAETATPTDFSKLSADDLQDKLKEIKGQVGDLAALETREPDQEAELIDKLDEADQIRDALTLKKDHELKARLDSLNKWDVPKPRKTGSGQPAAEPFDSFGHRLAAVANFRLHGHLDPRLLQNALGANETTPSEAGFLVGSDAETELMSKVYGSPILSGIRRTPISANSNMLKLRLLKENSRADGSRQGGVQAYWETEAGSVTASKREYDELELTLKKLMAVTYSSSELLEDHAALEAENDDGFREEMTFKLEHAVINGDGAGKPLGILADNGAKITVPLEDQQSLANPLVYDNVTKMYARLHPRSQLSAIWLIDQTLIPFLMTLSIPIGTGGAPVYVPSNGAADAPFGTLLGRPVVHTEHTQKKGTEGDIILWDPASYRLIEKGGVKGASSMHVAFLTDEMAFRYTYRTNGAPKWREPLTPKNGGDTLSTVVTLAART